LNRSSRDFLCSLVDYEKISGYDYDLDAYKNFLEHFDAPHTKLSNVILIGGTKGKGSTAAILTACLMNNGYRVGLYTSPHLMEINERIRIDNTEISDSDFDRYVMVVKPSISKTKGARSFFEALTTIGFLYFLEQRVDFTVLEVGLGGRLDATNATNPLISVITRIGYDHMNLLGNTLAEIAREKAGIIRENGRLITIHQRPSAGYVIEKIAANRKSTVIFADEQHSVEILDQSLGGSRVSISGRIGRIETTLPLPGLHQIENLSIAMAVLYELRSMGFRISPKKIGSGIKNTQLHGRFEVISQKPLIIFDCAHNQDSFRALNRNLDLFDIKDFYLIFGSNRDKDIRYCLKHIFPRAKEVLLVKADNPRAIEPRELIVEAGKYQRNITLAASVRNALDLLTKRQDKTLPIIIAGSFYLWPLDEDGLLTSA
jgi:dihydrofolate synthase/folylpolyglutamate synthase